MLKALCSASFSARIFALNRSSAASAGEYAGPGMVYRGGAPGSVPGMHPIAHVHSTAFAAVGATNAPRRAAPRPIAASRRVTLDAAASRLDASQRTAAARRARVTAAGRAVATRAWVEAMAAAMVSIVGATVRVRVSDRSISIQQDKRAEDLIEPSTVIIPPRLTTTRVRGCMGYIN